MKWSLDNIFTLFFKPFFKTTKSTFDNVFNFIFVKSCKKIQMLWLPYIRQRMKTSIFWGKTVKLSEISVDVQVRVNRQQLLIHTHDAATHKNGIKHIQYFTFQYQNVLSNESQMKVSYVMRRQARVNQASLFR